jgi:hypothetical protein
VVGSPAGIDPARLRHAFGGLLRRFRAAVGVLRIVSDGSCGVRLAWVDVV